MNKKECLITAAAFCLAAIIMCAAACTANERPPIKPSNKQEIVIPGHGTTTIYTVSFDSCQYVVVRGASHSALALTHKGNCNNPNH